MAHGTGVVKEAATNRMYPELSSSDTAHHHPKLHHLRTKVHILDRKLKMCTLESDKSHIFRWRIS